MQPYQFTLILATIWLASYRPDTGHLVIGGVLLVYAIFAFFFGRRTTNLRVTLRDKRKGDAGNEH